MKQVKAIIIGAGNRGQGYATYAEDFPQYLKIVGVCDPLEIRRKRLQEIHNIPDDRVFCDWSDVVKVDKFADAVIVTTPDQFHKAPSVACADKGYHVLLEKPMAISADDCCAIAAACKRNNVMLVVCHVLRYAGWVKKIKELIDSGVIGDVVNIQHTEPVGYWHFAHSYVRGNWRNEEGSSFTLLTKCCHDVDLIQYWMGSAKCTHVSSFGSLNHFKKEKKPEGAGMKCMDCKVEKNCPYSAKKLYLEGVSKGDTGWPISVVCEVPDIESITEALQTGPYGRCVYECDNDVCDNQVVNFMFDGCKTASLTMMAFTERVCNRETVIYGTKGEIRYNGDNVILHEFTSESSEYFPGINGAGHDYADFQLMDAFVKAVSTNDTSKICTGVQEILASHLLVFAAEKARKENRVITLNDDYSCQ